MAITDVTTNINITGSGFYDSGNVTFTVIANGANSQAGVTTYTTVATSTGSVTYTISIASISGINSAVSVSITATDNTTNISSNTVNIPVAIVNVAPTLSYAGGTIDLASSTGSNSTTSSTSSAGTNLTTSNTSTTTVAVNSATGYTYSPTVTSGATPTEVSASYLSSIRSEAAYLIGLSTTPSGAIPALTELENNTVPYSNALGNITGVWYDPVSHNVYISGSIGVWASTPIVIGADGYVNAGSSPPSTAIQIA